ncbi:hypothetical protein CTheo_2315 [Ceratobasidium theobromae]|uniref:Uncharacterized protein n=1 Tax=Ceratobasidium theobromae TaxID=1582974 RepID=A0A5N5QRA1_9AGAM|nr:hypothetical protein CTheo_2315 [Ceratobasidium theobromae]
MAAFGLSGGSTTSVLFIVVLFAYVSQTELTQYVQSSLGFRQPYLIFYVAHSSFSFVLPLHLLYLKLSTGTGPSTYMTSLWNVMHHQVLAPWVRPSTKFPWNAYAVFVFILTVGMSWSAILWYLSVSLAPLTDITAIFNTHAFWAYLMSTAILPPPPGRSRWQPYKLLAVLFACAGVLVTVYGGAKVDTGTEGSARFWGDMLVLLSAVGYALDQVAYKKFLVPAASIASPSYEALATSDEPASERRETGAEEDDERLQETLPFGLFANFVTSTGGLATFATLWVPMGVAWWTGDGRFKLPGDWWTAGCVAGIAVSGLAYNAGFMILLSLWGPIVASVGNLLTIVLIMAVDGADFHLVAIKSAPPGCPGVHACKGIGENGASWIANNGRYVQSSLQFKQPYLIFYIAHSSFSFVLPLHLLYLKLSTGTGPSTYMTSLWNVMHHQILAPLVGPGAKFPWGAYAMFVFFFTMGMSVPSMLWYLSISLAPLTDITAIFNTHAFWAYLMSTALLPPPPDKSRWQPYKLLAVLFACVGVVVTVYGGARVDTGTKESGRFWGDMMVLFAAVSYALDQVAYKKFVVPQAAAVASPSYEALAMSEEMSVEGGALGVGEDDEQVLPFGLFANFVTSSGGIATFGVLWLPIAVVSWFGEEKFEMPGDWWTAGCVAGIVVSGLVYSAGFMVSCRRVRCAWFGSMGADLVIVVGTDRSECWTPVDDSSDYGRRRYVEPRLSRRRI